MKKIVSLLLALMLVVFSVSALAEAKTVTFKANIDSEQLTSLAPMLNIDSTTQGMITPVAAIVNALSFRIVATDTAGEIDIDLNNGQRLVAIGGTLNDSGVVLGCSLVPSYLFTISPETLQQLVQQVMEQIPGGGAGMDIDALTEAVGGYVQKFTEALGKAITPGTAESVTLEVEGYTFDTKTPMNVDVMAIAEAVKTLVSDLVHDQNIAGMIQATGQSFNPDEVVEQISQGMTAENMPDVTVDVYTSSKDGNIFYAESTGTFKDPSAPALRLTIFGDGQGTVKAHLYVTDQSESVEIALTITQNSFALELIAAQGYAALRADVRDDGATIGVYFMNQVKALLTLDVTVADGGAVSLDLNTANKTTISIEDMQNGNVDESVQQGLMNELQNNAMGLLGPIMTAIPEASSLITMLMSR